MHVSLLAPLFRLFTRAIADSDNEETRFGRAKIYIRTDRSALAIRDLQRALDINSSHLASMSLLGSLLLSEHRAHEAALVLQIAVDRRLMALPDWKSFTCRANIDDMTSFTERRNIQNEALAVDAYHHGLALMEDARDAVRNHLPCPWGFLDAADYSLRIAITAGEQGWTAPQTAIVNLEAQRLLSALDRGSPDGESTVSVARSQSLHSSQALTPSTAADHLQGKVLPPRLRRSAASEFATTTHRPIAARALVAQTPTTIGRSDNSERCMQSCQYPLASAQSCRAQEEWPTDEGICCDAPSVVATRTNRVPQARAKLTSSSTHCLAGLQVGIQPQQASKTALASASSSNHVDGPMRALIGVGAVACDMQSTDTVKPGLRDCLLLHDINCINSLETNVVSQPAALPALFYCRRMLQAPGPFPIGVDCTRREDYLADNEFTSTFGVSRAVWNTFPAWKKISSKKSCGLF